MMKYRPRVYLVVVVGLLLTVVACNRLFNLQTSENLHLQPSATSAIFNTANYRDFSDYLEKTKNTLRIQKVFMDEHNKQRELDAAIPFELAPAEHCSNQSQNGILLIHGLADMPLAMGDLAQAFSEQCFLVRAVLLPGHGSRAADLLSVTRQDWLNAVRFGIKTLKQDVDQVYVGGFSLGGLLSVYTAAKDPEIKGVFAFSPALSLGSDWQIRQSVWLRHVIDWIDKDKQDDYARFEAMPVNAIAETYLLGKELQQLIDQQPLTTPVFVVQSSDDPVIDTIANQTYFSHKFTNSNSRLIVYQQNPLYQQHPDDKRIQYINSNLPEQRIVGFSHQSTHISPTNIHYGVNGDYRNCGVNADRSEKEIRQCLTATEVWRGELFGRSSELAPANQALARLTFNPYFDQLMRQINTFIRESEGGNNSG